MKHIVQYKYRDEVDISQTSISRMREPAHPHILKVLFGLTIYPRSAIMQTHWHHPSVPSFRLRLP
jgi:hypothetical protein